MNMSTLVRHCYFIPRKLFTFFYRFSITLIILFSQSLSIAGQSSDSLNINVCAGGSTTLYSKLNGSLQWQLWSGNCFEKISDNDFVKGTNSDSLQLFNIPSYWQGYIFRCISEVETSSDFKINITNSWTGSADSSWENPNNWSCGIIPDQFTSVTIEAGIVVTSMTTRVAALSIASKAKMILQAGIEIIPASHTESREVSTNYSAISQIPEVFAWYDATDTSTLFITDRINIWHDKTGNGFHLSESGNARPSYYKEGGGNNQPYVHFSIGTRLFKRIIPQRLGVFTAFFVLKRNDSTNDARAFFYNLNKGAAGIINRTSPTRHSGFSAYDGVSAGTPDLNTGSNNWQVVRVVFKGNAASGIGKNMLGGFDRFHHFLAPGKDSLVNMDYISLSNLASDIDFSEAIFVKGEPNNADRSNIVAYLMNKYGIRQDQSLIFFGDSHTQGFLSGSPSGIQYSILTGKEKGYDQMNLGVSSTVVWPYGPYGGSPLYNLSAIYKTADPFVGLPGQYIIFQYGTNDGNTPFTNPEWKSNYKKYIAHFINLGTCPANIIICSPPYNSNPAYSSNLAKTRIVIAEIAREMGIQFADFYQEMLAVGLNCFTVPGGDGIHGNADIHRKLADILKGKIK